MRWNDINYMSLRQIAALKLFWERRTTFGYVIHHPSQEIPFNQTKDNFGWWVNQVCKFDLTKMEVSIPNGDTGVFTIFASGVTKYEAVIGKYGLQFRDTDMQVYIADNLERMWRDVKT